MVRLAWEFPEDRRAMNSLVMVTLLVLPVFAVLLIALGSAVRWLLGSLLDRDFRRPFVSTGDLLTRVVTDFALGGAAITLLFLFFGLAGVRLGAPLVYTVVAVTAVTLVYRATLLRATLVPSLVRFLRETRWEILGLAVIGVISWLIRMVPYTGLYVFDGNDIRQYTLLTQLIIANGSLPTSWGAFAYPSWNLVWTNNHLIFTGTESIFAFTSFVVPVDLPQLTSAVALLFNAAVPILGYVVARRLFPQQGKAVGYGTALALAVLAAYPLFFEQWGGIDEITGWVVLLGFVAHFLTDPAPGQLGWKHHVTGALFLGGLLVISPIVFAYAVCFLVAYAGESLVRRASWRSSLGRPGFVLLLGLVLSSPLLIRGIQNALQTGQNPGSAGWGTFATAPILRYGEWGGSFYRLVTLTAFEYAWPMVVTGGIGLILALVLRKVYRHAFLLAFWAGLLFLLNENGPFGLFLVPYPAWNSIYPDRVAEFLFVIASLGFGVSVSVLVRGLRGRKETGPVPRTRLRRFFPGWVVRVIAASFTVVLIVASSNQAYYTYKADTATVIWGESLVGQDLGAYQWISAHAPAGTTILVDNADSGTWIPEFDGIRVYPYSELISNNSILNQYRSMAAQMAMKGKPDFVLYSQVGEQFHLGYAFYGGKHAYGLSNSIPLGALVDSPPVKGYTSHLTTSCASSSNFTLTICGANGSAVIAGPIVLSLEVWRNATVVGTYVVDVPANTSFTYVNPGPGSPFPGTWSAHISAVAPGTIVYRGSNERTFVIALDAGYFVSQCSALPLEGSCAPSGSS